MGRVCTPGLKLPQFVGPAHALPATTHVRQSNHAIHAAPHLCVALGCQRLLRLRREEVVEGVGVGVGSLRALYEASLWAHSHGTATATGPGGHPWLGSAAGRCHYRRWRWGGQQGTGNI
jgi:hypothetical protein